MAKWIAGAFVAFTALVVIVLWATAEPEISRAAMEKQYATPPSQFIQLADGTRIHFRDRGPRTGPTLILLHGFAGSLFVWESWSHALSDQFRIVSLDLPGNGLTGPVPSGDYSQAAMAAAVKQVADRLGLAKFAVAGNSMGGAVAARLAELYPDRVTALILIDSSGSQTKTRPRLPIRYYAAQIPVLSREIVERFIGRHYPFLRMEGMGEAMTAHFRLRDDPYVWNHVQNIHAPTLILWGANDRLIPLAASEAWNNAITGSKLVVYPGAGHVSMADAPAASVKDARVFLLAHFTAQ